MLTTKICVEYDYDEIYKMSQNELKQQNIDILVDHIVELKKEIAHDPRIRCTCGGYREESIFYDDCYNCNRPICDKCYIECDDRGFFYYEHHWIKYRFCRDCCE